MSKLSKGDFVVVDPGKHEVKVMVFTKTGTVKGAFAFPSKSKKVRGFNNYETSSNKQFRLKIGRKNFLLGEGVPAEFNSDVSKTNEHHKLCVYSSVASLIDNNEEDVNLVIGAPTNDFELSENVEKYSELIQGDNDGLVELTLNEIKKSFTIKNLVVFPEGMAVLPRALKQSPGKVHVIDIGGQNINYRLYDEKGNTNNYFSLDYAGMNKLEVKLKQTLRLELSYDSFDINSIDWNRAIEDKCIAEIDDILDEIDNPQDILVGFESTEEFMEEVIGDFIEDEIITEFSRNGVNLNQKGHFTLFTGGGSLRIQEYLKDSLSANLTNISFSQTAKWDNCISYAMRYLTQNESDKTLVKKAFIKIVKETKDVDFEEKHDLLEVEETPIG